MKRSFTGIMAFLSVAVVAGCDGPAGPPGPPGNANVLSFPLVFSMEDAVLNGNVASVQYEGGVIDAITLSVVEGGAVLMFFWEQGTWTAMPYTFGVESVEVPAVDYTLTLGFGYEEGFLEVFAESSADFVVEDLQEQGAEWEMKVVVIDGFAAAKAGVDLKNYEAVKAYFGLED